MDELSDEDYAGMGRGTRLRPRATGTTVERVAQQPWAARWDAAVTACSAAASVAHWVVHWARSGTAHAASAIPCAARSPSSRCRARPGRWQVKRARWLLLVLFATPLMAQADDYSGMLAYLDVARIDGRALAGATAPSR
jgi:hypothetical protein